jgi:hypothetical protein
VSNWLDFELEGEIGAGLEDGGVEHWEAVVVVAVVEGFQLPAQLD